MDDPMCSWREAVSRQKLQQCTYLIPGVYMSFFFLLHSLLMASIYSRRLKALTAAALWPHSCEGAA
jgi:hypothetical protein